MHIHGCHIWSVDRFWRGGNVKESLTVTPIGIPQAMIGKFIPDMKYVRIDRDNTEDPIGNKIIIHIPGWLHLGIYLSTLAGN